jgi:hypothetical protein
MKPQLLTISLLLTLSILAQAQNQSLFERKSGGADQWRSVGGKIVFQGSHDFGNFWDLGTNPNMGLYRMNTLDKTVKPTHTREEVARDVSVKMGEVTVTGPGWLALAKRSDYTHGRPVVAILDSPADESKIYHSVGNVSQHFGRVQWLIEQFRHKSDYFKPWTNSYSHRGSGSVKWPQYKTSTGYGWVRPGETKTYEIWAFNPPYSLSTSSAPTTFGPAKVQFEVWFFPRNEKPTAGGDKPTRYYSRPHLGSKSIPPLADNHVYAYSWQGWNQANWGKFENLAAGWHPSGGEKRAYFKFNLEGVPQNFGKATLRLYHYHTNGGNKVNLGVHRITAPWKEGRGTYKPATPAQAGELTWSLQPQFDPSPAVTFNPGSGVGKWVEVDITPLVKQWLSGAPNHGLVLKGEGLNSGTPESQYNFRSREFKEAELRPTLEISPQ